MPYRIVRVSTRRLRAHASPPVSRQFARVTPNTSAAQLRPRCRSRFGKLPRAPVSAKKRRSCRLFHRRGGGGGGGAKSRDLAYGPVPCLLYKCTPLQTYSAVAICPYFTSFYSRLTAVVVPRKNPLSTSIIRLRYCNVLLQ